MASTYDIGDYVRISSTFTQGGTVLDPTTVTLVLRAPDATSTTYTYAGATIIRESQGVYHVDVSVTAAGTYRYRWTTTGTGASSEEGWYQVRSRRVS